MVGSNNRTGNMHRSTIVRLLQVLASLAVLLHTPLLHAKNFDDAPRELSIAPTVDLVPRVPPNVILIVADDLGWGDSRAYGHRLLKTPNIDRLAAEGMLFAQYYVNSPVCSPSRAAIMTGRFPAEIGFHHIVAGAAVNAERGNVDFLDPSIPNIAKTLQEAGYGTAHIGKWHLTGGALDATTPSLTDYGFDLGLDWEDLVDLEDPFHRAHLPEVLVDSSIEYIGNHTSNPAAEPFYLNLWFVMPHAPLNPTSQQLWEYNELATNGAPFAGAQQIYYASVTALDKAIGRLLDYLDAQSLADNTVVIFTSDNGPEGIYAANARSSGVGSSGPFRGRKRSLYEGGVRQPLIVRYPDAVEAGRTEWTTVVSGVDLLPTILDLAITPPSNESDLDGESFRDVLFGVSRPRTKPLFWEWRFGDLDAADAPQINKSPMVAIRQGDHKLLFNPVGLVCGSRQLEERIELYDIVADPQEIKNLASERPTLVNTLLTEADQWRSSFPIGPCDDYAGTIRYAWP